MLKRILATICIMTIAVMTIPMSSFAATLGGGKATGEQVIAAMDRVASSAGKLDELENASQVASTLSEVWKVAGYVSGSLALINGSVTFMKLIGVMEDPTASKLDNILSQLNGIEDTLTSMDSKLNGLATQMTEMQATMEYNDRGEKALLLDSAWKTFEHDYMEDGLDELMSEYNGKLINGAKAWCSNPSTRYSDGVDNTQVVLIYGTDNKGNEVPVYVSANGIPPEYTENKYVVIPSSVMNTILPSSYTFNVNTYQDTLVSGLSAAIKAELEAGNYSIFDSKNFPLFTSAGTIDDEAITAVATDAINVLLYRVGAVEVNKDAAFALEVNRAFTNYCQHLLSANDGIDAFLKTVYLTHTFEYETKDLINDFYDRIIFKTGIYGTFVMNVQGMSDATADSTKEDAATRFVTTIDSLDEALNNSLTGEDQYCYITGTKVLYTDCHAINKLWMDVERVYNDKETYKTYSPEYCRITTNNVNRGEYAYVGDVNALFITYTLKNNGVNPSWHDYFNEHLAVKKVKNYSYILTSHGEEENLPLDGSVPMQPFNVLGNDFKGINTFKLTSNDKDYPDDAASKYIVYHKKISGSLLAENSGKIATNNTLLATAVYGQSHSLWFKDEAAFFAGPNTGDFNEFITNSIQESKFEYSEMLIAERYFDALVAVPLSPSLKGSDNNPLASFAALNAEMDKGNLPKDKENPKEDPEITAPDTYDGRGTLMATLMMLLASLMVWRMKKAKATAN